MKNKLILIEKILSVFQIAFGSLIIYIIIRFLNLNYKMMQSHLNTEWANGMLYTNIKLSSFHLLLALFLIIAGILLMLSKKIGWSLSLSLWFLTAYSFIFFFSLPDVTTTFLVDNKLKYWILGGLFLLILCPLILLLLKPIREKYFEPKKSFLQIGVIFLFFFLMIFFITI